jgi:hypothetical protein
VEPNASPAKIDGVSHGWSVFTTDPSIIVYKENIGSWEKLIDGNYVPYPFCRFLLDYQNN